MADMKLFLQILANASGLKREMGESGSAVNRFTQGAKREFSSLKGAMGSLQGKLAGIGVSIAALQQFRMSAQLDKDLTQIGQTAGEGAGQVAQLRSDLFRMGKDSGQDIDSLKNGFNALVQSGLNMGEAKSTLDGVNIAMAVTGAKAETLSAGLTVAAQAFQFDLAKPGQALELLDKMTVAGRLGNAELEGLSQIFARVGINAKAAGLDFDKTLGFLESLSKVERNPERLATLADSTLRVFTNMNYMASAQKGTGIKFYSDTGKRRDPLEVLKNIKSKYDTLKTDFARDSFVQAAFGKSDLDTIKGIRTLLQSNSLAEVGRMSGMIKDAGGSLKRDFSEATRNLIDQTGRLKNTMRAAADDFVKPINQTLSDWMSFMMDKKEKGGLELSGQQIAGGTAAILGGTYALSKVGNALLGNWTKKKIGSLSGSTAVGVAEGKLLQAATGVTPVFVTNWPAGGMPGAPVLPPTVPGAASQVGKYIAPAALYSLPVAVAAAPFISKFIGETAIQNGWGSQTSAEVARDYEVMGIGGGRRGSAGTKNDIKIDVHFDELGRAYTKTNSMNTAVTTGGNRGNFFDALTSTRGM